MRPGTLFRLRAIAALNIAGRRVVPGSEIHLDAASASDLIRAGQAVLVDADDIGVLVDAVAGSRFTAGTSTHR